MIGYLHGKIKEKNDGYIVIDVHDVGYKVFLTEYAIEQHKESDEISLHIYMHVREQEITLYGFFDTQEKDIFELLISVSGIGPKAALNILDVADVSTICAAIAAEDTTILTKVSGIGPKTAKKVVNELSDKITAPADVSANTATVHSDAIDALKSMGYSVAEARNALADVPKDVTDVGECVRIALKNLGK